MEAIVLAGGFGTRLAHVVSDVPKPMAPVCNRPFLRFILDDLQAKGIERVVLAVGYKQEVIRDYFGAHYRGMQIVYSSEDTPLFTGGAIKKALQSCRYLFRCGSTCNAARKRTARCSREANEEIFALWNCSD